MIEVQLSSLFVPAIYFESQAKYSHFREQAKIF